MLRGRTRSVLLLGAIEVEQRTPRAASTPRIKLKCPDRPSILTRLHKLFPCGQHRTKPRTGRAQEVAKIIIEHCVPKSDTFVLPSFDAYCRPFERGGASTGQTFAGLPEEVRRAVREEVRRDLADSGGPVEAEAEYRIASAGSI